jgi:SAM-dependent methyltransferase
MLQSIKNLFSGQRADRRTGALYEAMLRAEQDRYAEVDNVHDLPGIFHYWSNTHLVPALKPFGYSSPNHFFEKNIASRCRAQAGRTIRIFSPGAGNCDLEAGIAECLAGEGIDNYRIDCLDINRDMLRRGRERAAALGLENKLRFVEGDFNHWRAEPGTYDVVMANQSLHHVMALEHLFDAIRESLANDGIFLMSDMIGRNGHMRWPEALAAMQPFWEELPPSYRYNQQLQRDEKTYVDYDCSTHDFEGVRSQDILPLLCERFGFEFFFPYGNIVFPFIDRAFGHNFDPNHDFDRYFINRVHQRDEQGIVAGEWTPTSMIAIAVKGKARPILREPALTPEYCIRRP